MKYKIITQDNNNITISIDIANLDHDYGIKYTLSPSAPTNIWERQCSVKNLNYRILYNLTGNISSNFNLNFTINRIHQDIIKYLQHIN